MSIKAPKDRLRKGFDVYKAPIIPLEIKKLEGNLYRVPEKIETPETINQHGIFTPLDLSYKNISPEQINNFLRTFLGFSTRNSGLPEEDVLSLADYLKSEEDIQTEIKDAYNYLSVSILKEKGRQIEIIQTGINNAVKKIIANRNKKEKDAPNGSFDKALDSFDWMDGEERKRLRNYLVILAEDIASIKQEYGEEVVKNQELLQLKLQEKNIERFAESIDDAIGFWEEYLLLELNGDIKDYIEKTKYELKSWLNSNNPEKDPEASAKIIEDFIYNITNSSYECPVINTRCGDAFLKIFFASIETNKKPFKNRKEISKEMGASLFDKFYYETEPDGWVKIRGSLDDDDKIINIDERIKLTKKAKRIYDENGNLVAEATRDKNELMPIWEAKVTTRAKSKYRMIAKALCKPKFNVFEAVDDDIGCRVEVTSLSGLKRALEYVLESDYAQERAKPGTFKIRTKNLFVNDEDEFKKFCSKLGVKDVRFEESPFFTDAKVTFNLKDGNSAEIQIVLAGNNNETGMSHHGVYEPRQIMSNMMPRLFPEITEEFILKHEARAFERSFKKDEVEKELKKEICKKIGRNISKKDDESQEDFKARKDRAITKSMEKAIKKAKKQKKEAINELLRKNLIETYDGYFIAKKPSSLEKLGELPTEIATIINKARQWAATQDLLYNHLADIYR